MRKIIVYIATSADGLIARKDGSVVSLDRPSIKGDYGRGKFSKERILSWLNHSPFSNYRFRINLRQMEARLAQ